QSSKGVLDPVSEDLLSEPAIVCGLAKATLGNKSMIGWDKYSEHYDNIRKDIERTIPGFENYNERIRKPGGFYLPHCNREKKFDTPSQKAMFNISNYKDPVLKEDELVMMTIRSHDQFNTTIYGLDDRYRGIYNERRVVMMNRDDIAKLKMKDGDIVDLVNFEGGKERVARNFIIVEYPIPEGCVATYFPEANVLVPITSVAEKSNTPASKQVVVKIVLSSEY
ncbi:MAG: molybdopterin dinucleotide binding domain-containing protein, partial [Ignavibacteria bacterium]